MSNPEDTEILLALVSSLLRDPVDDQASLLDALVRANGNVEEAVRRIESKNDDPRKHAADNANFQTDGKRKRKAGLEEWLLSSVEKSGGDATDASSSTAKRPRSRRSATPIRQSHPNASSRGAISEFVEGNSKPDISPVKAKPVSQSEFLSLFRPPNPAESPQKASPPKFPPLTLATPELVAKHSPCSLHLSVLPPELACRYGFAPFLPGVSRRSHKYRLFYTMLDESEGWYKNKWWLFDRVVESPHRTSFYIRRSPAGTKSIDMQEAAQYWCALIPVLTGELPSPTAEMTCEGITDDPHLRPTIFLPSLRRHANTLSESSMPRCASGLASRWNGVVHLVNLRWDLHLPARTFSGAPTSLHLIATRVQVKA